MATKIKEENIQAEVLEQNEDYLEEYVEVFLFKDNRDYKDDVFLSVNGENCVVKRGVPVKIKRKFDLVLKESMLQRAKAEEKEAELEAEARGLMY